MRVNNLMVVCALAFVLGACSFFSGPKVDPVVVKTEEVKIDILHPQLPTKVPAPKKVDVIVITPGVIKQMQDDGVEDYVYFGFTENDYLSFAEWLQNLLRYIKQQGAIIDYYRRATLPPLSDAEKEALKATVDKK